MNGAPVPRAMESVVPMARVMANVVRKGLAMVSADRKGGRGMASAAPKARAMGNVVLKVTARAVKGTVLAKKDVVAPKRTRPAPKGIARATPESSAVHGPPVRGTEIAEARAPANPPLSDHPGTLCVLRGKACIPGRS